MVGRLRPTVKSARPPAAVSPTGGRSSGGGARQGGCSLEHIQRARRNQADLDDLRSRAVSQRWRNLSHRPTMAAINESMFASKGDTDREESLLNADKKLWADEDDVGRRVVSFIRSLVMNQRAAATTEGWGGGGGGGGWCCARSNIPRTLNPLGGPRSPS